MTYPSPPPPAPDGVLLPPPNPPPRRPATLAPQILGAPADGGGRPANSRAAFVVAIATALLAGLFAAAFAVVKLVATRRASPLDEAAVVRVVSGTSSGTGFFVAAPNAAHGVLVVTAFHVVDSGAAPVVERIVRTSRADAFVEAYPDTEIVAFDPEADLAVLRVPNLPVGRVAPLRLAVEPERDEPIVSAGYPASSFTKRVALLKKEGKLLDLTKLPAVDHPSGRLVRESAVEGIIVSTDLEPGFSGGPTVNAKGEVVGVNVIKDTAHRGQNGAVSSAAVKRLLAQIRPFAPPAPSDVEALLKQIQDQSLLLAMDDRGHVAEHELVALADIPRLKSLVGEVRAMDQDGSEHDFGNGVKASGRALLGILLARLPGKGVETYAASATQRTVRQCEDAAHGIKRFFGDVDGAGSDVPRTDCARLATRALAWDLAAASLEWSGAPREYTVTKIEEVDPDAHVFRANVKMSGIASLVPVYVVWDAGRYRLELFDASGRLYALGGSRASAGSDFQGTWVARKDRGPDATIAGVLAESQEKLVVSITGTDGVSIAHQYKLARFAGRAGALFSCNRKAAIVDEGNESLTGMLHNGVVSGTSTRVDTGEACKQCGLCMTPHKLFVAKIHAGKLILYRTNGVGAPDAVEFVRE